MGMAVQTTKPEGAQGGERAAEGSQYLTFVLGEELYGVDILRVQEIKGYTSVTRIPNTPPYIKGVLNLRGTIVPIVDLRTKFGMEAAASTMFTVVIVVTVRDRVMGFVVDSVSDVLTINNTEVQPPPEFGARVDVQFLNGIGQCGDKLIALLNLDRLLNGDEVEAAAAAAA